jgi:hypothetical protein
MKGKLLNNSGAGNNYMVDINLPELLSNEFIKLIPKQRSYVKKMMGEGVISNYSLSYDRRKLWVVINADTPQEAKAIIESFPIYNHITFKINSLLFHETNITSMPHMWLN